MGEDLTSDMLPAPPRPCEAYCEDMVREASRSAPPSRAREAVAKCAGKLACANHRCSQRAGHKSETAVEREIGDLKKRVERKLAAKV